MKCPYFDCTDKGLTADTASCRTCRRPLKICGFCGHLGRAFANYCADCGEPMVGGDFDWTGYRGGPRRLGMNPAELGDSWMKAKLSPETSGITLDEACFDLLSWDRHLLAVGESGRVEIRHPGAAVGYSLRLDGSPSCHACIEKSTLFVGHDSTLAAYSLGALTLKNPQTSARWSISVPGRPSGALLAVKDALLVNVTQGRDVGVALLEGIFDDQPPRLRWLQQPGSVSPLAGDRNTGKAHFLSSHGGKIRIHTVHAHGQVATVDVSTVPDLSESDLTRSALAVMGKNLFAVLGPEQALYRLEPGKPTVRLETDVRRFSLNRGDQQVLLRTTGLRFPHGHDVELSHMERVIGQPLILRNFALAVGLQDGRLGIYDLNNPPFLRHERIDGHAITALASFGPYVAAGTARGTVALYQVVPS